MNIALEVNPPRLRHLLHAFAFTSANTPSALTLVQDVISVFVDDPLPALYEKNAGDTTGLDILYAGTRIDTTVGL